MSFKVGFTEPLSLEAELRSETIQAIENIKWVLIVGAITMPVANAALIFPYVSLTPLLAYVAFMEVVGLIAMFFWFSPWANNRLNAKGVPAYAMTASLIWMFALGLLPVFVFDVGNAPVVFMAGNAMAWGIIAGLNSILDRIDDYRRELSLVVFIPNQIASGLAGQWHMVAITIFGMFLIYQGVSGSNLSYRRLIEHRRALARKADNEAERSRTDDLTGLLNRHGLSEVYTRNQHKAALYIDLDKFKAVNDNFGHLAGDKVLVEISRRLKQACRETDSVARVGGDEFVILCQTTNPDYLSRLAERIKLACGFPIGDGDNSYQIAASIGISVSELGTDLEHLLNRSDMDMLRSKPGHRQSSLPENNS